MRIAGYNMLLELSHLISRLLFLRPMEGHHRIPGGDAYVARMANVMGGIGILLRECLLDALTCKLLSFIIWLNFQISAEQVSVAWPPLYLSRLFSRLKYSDGTWCNLLGYYHLNGCLTCLLGQLNVLDTTLFRDLHVLGVWDGPPLLVEFI
jgi:hypothetical protein